MHARRRWWPFWVCGTDPGNLPEAGARSSVVELWFYTPAVGGSIPSAPTINVQLGDLRTSSAKSPLCQECAKGCSRQERVPSQRADPISAT